MIHYLCRIILALHRQSSICSSTWNNTCFTTRKYGGNFFSELIVNCSWVHYDVVIVLNWNCWHLSHDGTTITVHFRPIRISNQIIRCKCVTQVYFVQKGSVIAEGHFLLHKVIQLCVLISSATCNVTNISNYSHLKLLIVIHYCFHSVFSYNPIYMYRVIKSRIKMWQ